MKVFVTGASGFVGSAVVSELISAGHQVTGLARSEASAKSIREAGAHVLSGSLDDLMILKQGTLQADGVIHTAFNNDLAEFHSSAIKDKKAIQAIGEALLGTDKPFITTSGTLGLPITDGRITEETRSPENSPRFSESTTFELADKGIHASVVRLSPNVHGRFHDNFKAGFALIQMELAKKTGVAAYIGDGSSRLPAVHVSDAAKLFVLALEKGERGACYHAVDNYPLLQAHELAAFIGKKLSIPVKSVSPEEAQTHFGPLYWFLSFDNPAISSDTQSRLNWNPSQISLLDDLQLNYI